MQHLHTSTWQQRKCKLLTGTIIQARETVSKQHHILFLFKVAIDLLLCTGGMLDRRYNSPSGNLCSSAFRFSHLADAPNCHTAQGRHVLHQFPRKWAHKCAIVHCSSSSDDTFFLYIENILHIKVGIGHCFSTSSQTCRNRMLSQVNYLGYFLSMNGCNLDNKYLTNNKVKIRAALFFRFEQYHSELLLHINLRLVALWRETNTVSSLDLASLRGLWSGSHLAHLPPLFKSPFSAF